MKHINLPAHLTDRFVAVFEHALHHGRPEVPVRIVPPAADWDDWHWYPEGNR